MRLSQTQTTVKHSRLFSLAACLSASAVSSNACLSPLSLLPLGKHFYQNITRCCLWTDTYTQMKVNSCHSQVNNREVTIFRKHYPMCWDSWVLVIWRLALTSHSSQDFRIHESISVWGPVCDNGLPISSVPNLPTPKNLNLQFGVSPLCVAWCEQHPGMSANQRPGLGHADQSEAGLELCDVMWAIRREECDHWDELARGRGSQGWYQDHDNR